MGTAQLFDYQEAEMTNEEAVRGRQAWIAAGAAEVDTPFGLAVRETNELYRVTNAYIRVLWIPNESD